MFTPAVQKDLKLRLAITGVGKAGKTWTSLEIAKGFGGRIALLDTEKDSAAKYAKYFKFDRCNIEAPYHPQKYIDAIHEAEEAGYRTIILDSLTHVWSGSGGILSIVDDITSHSSSHNSVVAWNQAGDPLYRNLIDTILQSKLHVIGTIRSKQKHVVVVENGKTKMTRVGVRPIQREDFEFEFDVIMDMDLENNATITGSRCHDLLPRGMVIQKPGQKLANTLMTWLMGGDWTDALDEKAVAFAAENWNMAKSAAFTRLSAAVAQEKLSEVLPKEEFKEYVLALA